MAIEESPSGGNLGPVLETYGGKSLKGIVVVGVAIFGCGQIALFLIRMFQPDYLGLMLVIFVLSLGFALGYVWTNWAATLAKVEACEGGVRLLVRGRIAWDKKGDLTRAVPGIVELPWDRIRKVEVGHIGTGRGWRPHVVIRTTDGDDVELPYGFWAAVGTSRFAAIVDRFVADVEVDVDLN